MAEQDKNQAQEIAKDNKVPQVLVKEASEELATKLYTFAQCCRSINALERQLKKAREERLFLLKENPWLGNVQGVLNKEASKMATLAYEEPEAEQGSDVQMEDEALSERKDIPKDLIPLKPKPGPRPVSSQRTPEAVRASLSKKMNKSSEIKRKSSSQFGPEHPSHGQ